MDVTLEKRPTMIGKKVKELGWNQLQAYLKVSKKLDGVDAVTKTLSLAQDNSKQIWLTDREVILNQCPPVTQRDGLQVTKSLVLRLKVKGNTFTNLHLPISQGKSKTVEGEPEVKMWEPFQGDNLVEATQELKDGRVVDIKIKADLKINPQTGDLRIKG